MPTYLSWLSFCAILCCRLQVLAFPVQMLVRFWVNHHLLDLVQRPCWRVVKGRSKTYVDKVLAGQQLLAQQARINPALP